MKKRWEQLVARVQQLVQDVEGFVQRATPRERVILAALAAGGVLALVFLISVAFAHAIHRREQAIASKTKSLQEITQLAATYGERSRARQLLEQRLKAKVALFTFIDDVSKREHIEIGDMQDHGSNTGTDKITESTVELDLNKLTLDKLTDFLNALEHDPHLIKVKKIRLRGRIDDPNSVDVSMTIAAYAVAGAT
jgi:type II secretory pathway component PulM